MDRVDSLKKYQPLLGTKNDKRSESPTSGHSGQGLRWLHEACYQRVMLTVVYRATNFADPQADGTRKNDLYFQIRLKSS